MYLGLAARKLVVLLSNKPAYSASFKLEIMAKKLELCKDSSIHANAFNYAV